MYAFEHSDNNVPIESLRKVYTNVDEQIETVHEDIIPNVTQADFGRLKPKASIFLRDKVGNINPHEYIFPTNTQEAQINRTFYLHGITLKQSNDDPLAILETILLEGFNGGNRIGNGNAILIPHDYKTGGNNELETTYSSRSQHPDFKSDTYSVLLWNTRYTENNASPWDLTPASFENISYAYAEHTDSEMISVAILFPRELSEEEVEKRKRLYLNRFKDIGVRNEIVFRQRIY